jgi:hypothetical protein
MAEQILAPKVSVMSRVVVFSTLIALAAGTLGVLVWKLLWPALQTGTPPGTWTWTSLLGILLGLGAAITFIATLVVQKFSTELREDGVSFLTWRGRRFLRWSEIQTAAVRGHEILLKGTGVSGVINIFCFSDPNAVGAFVHAHLPKHLLESA